MFFVEQVCFLSPDRINVETSSDTLWLNVMPSKMDKVFFSEGVRISSSEKVNRYSNVGVKFNIAMFSNWAILLDEFLRFVGEEGKFSFYFQNSKFVVQHTCFSLLSKLFIQKNIDARLNSAESDLTRGLYVFDIQRCCVNHQERSWTFGILVDGRSPDMLDKFLSSVCTEFNAGNYKNGLEVIINGPETQEYTRVIDKYNLNIRHINTGIEFNHLGWITQKKNAIAREAKYQNIALFHNRYALHSGWLRNFDQFGYDFELVSLKQEIGNKRFPDWVAAGSRWSLAKSFLLDPNDYHPHLYVNGGVIVAKKWVLEKYPLNELLFWDQAEDLESTFNLMSNGILPRYASMPSVEVLAMRKDFKMGFKVQNSLFQSICGYDSQISRFSPVHMMKKRIRGLFR